MQLIVCLYNVRRCLCPTLQYTVTNNVRHISTSGNKSEIAEEYKETDKQFLKINIYFM